MAEYTPELDQSILEALKRKILEQEQQQIAQARGASIASGLGAGSSYQALREAAANKSSINAQTDAMVNLALNRAQMQREERLISEDRAYKTSETEKQRRFSEDQAALDKQFANQQRIFGESYQALEAEKQRAFQKGEYEKARDYEQQQSRLKQDFESAENEKARKNELLNAGIQGGAYIAGQGLFGGGGAAEGAKGAIPMLARFGNVGKSFINPTGTGGFGPGASGAGSGLGSALGIGAGIAGGAAAGQLGAKLTGRNTREAKAGSLVGAGIGTAYAGPIGGIVGGAVGGLGTKLYQGIGKATGLNKITNKFCFDGATLIEMADGSHKRIDCIQLEDEVKDGGKVWSVRKGLCEDGDLYNYKGVDVTGFHAVFERGRWKRVKDSAFAIAQQYGGVVWSIVTEKHRMVVNGIVFADEVETDFYESLDLDASLMFLNSVLVPQEAEARV